jgi:hypothetical protein
MALSPPVFVRVARRTGHDVEPSTELTPITSSAKLMS